MMQSLSLQRTPWIGRMAKAGLTSKGIVYLALGTLAFMAAFEMGGHSNAEASQSGLFGFIRESTGMWLIILLSVGLLCYCLWRFTQAFRPDKGTKKLKRARYFFSGLAYAGLAFSAVQVILHQDSNNGDQNQHWASQMLAQPFGQVLTGICALLLAGIGIYQAWYGLSEKYKKHVKAHSARNGMESLLIKSGAVGYVARGIVWLIIAFLLFRAALYSNASEAGNTGKAFQFVESTMGSFLLGALGLGLVAYGIFNFIRARFERF